MDPISALVTVILVTIGATMCIDLAIEQLRGILTLGLLTMYLLAYCCYAITQVVL